MVEPTQRQQVGSQIRTRYPEGSKLASNECFKHRGVWGDGRIGRRAKVVPDHLVHLSAIQKNRASWWVLKVYCKDRRRASPLKMEWAGRITLKKVTCSRPSLYRRINLEHFRQVHRISVDRGEYFWISHLSNRWAYPCKPLLIIWAIISVVLFHLPQQLRHRYPANRWNHKRQNQQICLQMNSWFNQSNQEEPTRTCSWMSNPQNISISRTPKSTSASRTTRECCNNNQGMLAVANTHLEKRLGLRQGRETSGVLCQSREGAWTRFRVVKRLLKLNQWRLTPGMDKWRCWIKSQGRPASIVWPTFTIDNPSALEGKSTVDLPHEWPAVSKSTKYQQAALRNRWKRKSLRCFGWRRATLRGTSKPLWTCRAWINRTDLFDFENWI